MNTLFDISDLASMIINFFNFRVNGFTADIEQP